MNTGQIKLEGNTIEDKLIHLEAILTRLIRRSNKTITGVVPPSIIFEHFEEVQSGRLLSFVVPAKGFIQSICMVIDKEEKKEVIFTVTKKSSNDSMSYSIPTTRTLITENIKVDCKVGDVITVEIDSAVKTIDLSILYVIDYHHVQKIEIPFEIIDDLLESLE